MLSLNLGLLADDADASADSGPETSGRCTPDTGPTMRQPDPSPLRTHAPAQTNKRAACMQHLGLAVCGPLKTADAKLRGGGPRAQEVPAAGAMASLAAELGLGTAAQRLIRTATGRLLYPAADAERAPFPDARVEFSAQLGGANHPALRFAADAGDPCRCGADRARSALRDLSGLAADLGLADAMAQITRALGPVIEAAENAGPAAMPVIRVGLDLVEGPCGLHMTVTVQAGLDAVGPASGPDACLSLAAACLRQLGSSAAAADAIAMGGRLPSTGVCRTLSLALTGSGSGKASGPGQVDPALHWQFPRFDRVALTIAREALGLPVHPGMTPVIVQPAPMADPSDALSGLGIRFDPDAGQMPDLTLTTQAPRHLHWQDRFERQTLTHWAGGLGQDPVTLLALMAGLRRHGPAPRARHSLTLRPDGLQAAVYFHPVGWALALRDPATRQKAAGAAGLPSPLQPSGDCHE